MSRLLFLFVLLQCTLASSQIIVLDPGHGYCNDCTQNCTSNVRSDTEILTALAVGKKLEVLLNNCPTVTTYFTRETNDCGDFPSLSQRAAMANSWGADRFLSIHCNAGGGSGTETFWCDNSISSNAACQSYSEEIQTQMVLYGQWNDRRVVEDHSYLGFHLGVLAPTNAIGTLSEIGFVDSADEIKLLDDNWRNNFALAYYIALQNDLGISCSTTPINDNCSDSLEIISNTSCISISGTVNNATSDGMGSASCDAFTGTALEAGVFYNFTAVQKNHTITVTPTAMSTLDSVVAVYSGNDCNSLTEIACNDPSGSGAVTINLNNLNINDSYWIRIYDYGSVAPSNGDFNICVTHTPPANDLCDNSISLISNISCINTRGTVNDATSDGIGIGSCDAFTGTALEAGVFYNFTALKQSHTITVTPTNISNLDAVVVIYEGNDCNNLSEFDCYDTPGTGTVTITNNSFTPGNTYWIRIYDYGSAGPDNGSFDICITHTEEPDIVVQELYTVPENPSPGEFVTLYATAKNVGLEIADAFAIDFRIDNVSVGLENVTSLAAGASQTAFISNYVFNAEGTVNYCAYMSSPSGEINTSNNSYCIPVTVMDNVVRLSPKIYLQGALLNSTNQFMRDHLRFNNLIPTTSPYGDALTCDSSVFNTTGEHAVIDWVYVTLRDALDRTSVLAGSSALLLANGEVVTTDGTSEVTFNVPDGNYFIGISHRNHVGIISANTISLDEQITITDFSNGTTSAYGTNPLSSFGNTYGYLALWVGDSNTDHIIKFSGTNNDSNVIRDDIINDPGNIFGSISYSYSLYDTNDLNMDGIVKFSGTNNDSNVVKDIIVNHPGNIFNSISFSFSYQE